MGHDNTESKNEATDNEERHMETDTDQGDAYDHDGAPDHNAGPMTEGISCAGSKRRMASIEPMDMEAAMRPRI